MNETVEIRAAQAHDLDRVAEIWRASALAAADAPPAMPSVDELRARIDIELSASWTLWVVAGGGKIFGMLALKEGESILDQLYICPSAQGHGLGKQLLRHAMARMPAGFTLRTASANSGARAFYARMGLRLLLEDVHPRHGYPVSVYGWNIA
jgi:putative acetyltransferase